MTIWEQIITIAAVALGTMLTRFLPFFLFPANKQTPKYVQYLGNVLSFAVIGLLVVYCLKEVKLTVYPYGMPEIIAIAAVVLLHKWKKNMLLSIAGGTVLYMVLVQTVL